MDEIPSSWPPDPEDEPAPAPILPLFALPRVWLFPYVILPLRIFEERYKQMIEDHLDGAGRIVLGTVLDEHAHDVTGDPPIHPIAGLGEIGRHDRMPDGCFHILLVGLRRVRVAEAESDRLYRKVRAEPVREVEAPARYRPALREQLLYAIEERTKEAARIPAEIGLSHLADLLILRMPVDPPEVQSLYVELDVMRRVERALELHNELPELPEPPASQDAD